MSSNNNNTSPLLPLYNTNHNHNNNNNNLSSPLLPSTTTNYADEDPLPTYPAFKLRLREERQLLLRHSPILMTCSIFLVYFALVVFRNVAYYRFVPAPMLKDLGHEMFTEITTDSDLVDLPMYLFFGVFGITMFGSFVPPSSSSKLKKKPHFANILTRLMKVYAVGHFLRACTYLSTSLPGTARHCRPGSEKLDPPKSLSECFTRAVAIQGGCGDLNFSGHAMLLCMGTLFVTMYSYKLWDFPFFGTMHVSFISCAVILTLAQYYLILAARHHYTVDIVVATYTTPLLWYWFTGADDIVPDENRIRAEILRERKWPIWRRFLSAAGSFAVGIGAFLALVITLKGNLKGLVGT
jgi:hypothetical protein